MLKLSLALINLENPRNYSSKKIILEKNIFYFSVGILYYILKGNIPLTVPMVFACLVDTCLRLWLQVLLDC